MYGWVVPTMPTRELYVHGTQGQSPGIEPRTRRLKTTALAIGPSMSLTINPALSLGGGWSWGGVELRGGRGMGVLGEALG